MVECLRQNGVQGLRTTDVHHAQGWRQRQHELRHEGSIETSAGGQGVVSEGSRRQVGSLDVDVGGGLDADCGELVEEHHLVGHDEFPVVVVAEEEVEALALRGLPGDLDFALVAA